MARRWPIERTTWRTRVPLWLGVTALIVPLKYVVQYAAQSSLQPSRLRPLDEMIITGFIPESIAFWAMIGVILSIEYNDRWRHREVQTQALGRQLAEARLEILSAQLRPHFLFNTLQGISTLMHRDPHAADQMLSRLSELLRQSLRNADLREVTLAEELATLEHYLSIQRIRFQDRLAVTVESDGAANARLPHFILQPLVENAIEHGIARRSGPGTIVITARAVNDRLVVEVGNDCPAESAASREDGGHGLANTRARLSAMYGDAASLRTARLGESQFLVTLSIPLTREGSQ
jgi:LytS/YehU family sensor histidine kinase